MVTLLRQLFNLIFFNKEQLSYRGFPPLHLLFAQDLQNLYRTYFTVGWGHTLLIWGLGLVIIQALFGKKGAHRLAKVLLVIIGLCWVTTTNIMFKVQSFPTNLFFLPILQVPVTLVLLTTLILFGWLVWITRREMYQHLSFFMQCVVDTILLFLLLTAAWPLLEVPFIRM